MNKSTWYSPEVRERAVRMVFEHQGEHESPISHQADESRHCTPRTGRTADACRQSRDPSSLGYLHEEARYRPFFHLPETARYPS